MKTKKTEKTEPIVKATSLIKTFSDGKFKVEVLKGVSLEVSAGEMLGILGPSGCGIRSLLHILGGLDDPTSGKVEIDGVDISTLPENEKSILRNRYLGFVYQFHHLLPEFSALENIAMPLLIAWL